MRTLALDVGTKTIGVAVSDELGITANGVTTVKRTSISDDISALREIINELEPNEIVVGMPYDDEGNITKRGKDIEKFAKAIEKEFSLTIVFWDESFSTTHAEKALLEADVSRKKRKKVIDKLAAVVILREYLESKIPSSKKE